MYEKFMIQKFLMNRLVQVKAFISRKKLRKIFTDGLFKCLKAHEWSVPQISTLDVKNYEINSTKYWFENSQILYN